MKCPVCRSESRVYEVRTREDSSKLRRRECLNQECLTRFATAETYNGIVGRRGRPGPKPQDKSDSKPATPKPAKTVTKKTGVHPKRQPKESRPPLVKDNLDYFYRPIVDLDELGIDTGINGDWD